MGRNPVAYVAKEIRQVRQTAPALGLFLMTP